MGPVDGLRVVVCDAHRLSREALSFVIRAQPGVAGVIMAASAEEVVRAVRDGADLVVLDLADADDGGDGLEVLEALSHMRLGLPVLLLGEMDQLAVAVRAMRLGACGFVGKHQLPADLAAAIRRAVAGKTVLPPARAEQVLRRLTGPDGPCDGDAALRARLTSRELDVLVLLAAGCTRSQIAERLHVSTHTVRTHLYHAMAKLGVHSQLAAAALVREAHVDPVP